MYNHIYDIKSRLTKEDEKFLKDIYAPVNVTNLDEDAYRRLCVMPDGRIRFYGLYGKKCINDANALHCYIESTDGGLSWKRHLQNEGTLGASRRIPFGKYEGKYMGPAFANDKFCYAIADDPDSVPFLTIPMECSHPLIALDASTLPIFLKSRNRIIVIIHEHRPELHESCFFIKIHYSDDCGETWKIVDPGMAPMFEKKWPHKGIRWQQNFRESSIVELSDGSLTMFARTATDYLYITRSYDGGESWTTPEPSIFHSTGTNPCAYNLSDGRIVLCWCNTKPLPELEGEEGVWEDYFTNRDVNHIAITEDDGKTWKGFREMALNPIRHNPDFRAFGGNTFGDKSVHQFEILELPFNKLMVAYGQASACAKILILDLDWLYEKSRKNTPVDGLENLSTQSYIKSLPNGFRGNRAEVTEYTGHCNYNRISSVMVVPNPYDEGFEALSFMTNEDERLVSNIAGAVWNFPIARKGTVRVRAKIGGLGLRVSLLDHWMNPTDDTLPYFADYSIVLREDMHEKDEMAEFVFNFDCDKGEVTLTVGDYVKLTSRMNNNHPMGLCYLHMQTAAPNGVQDPEETIVSHLTFNAE